MVFVVAPGLFQPLEQEVSRALAHRRAAGIGGGPLVKRAAVLGGDPRRRRSARRAHLRHAASSTSCSTATRAARRAARRARLLLRRAHDTRHALGQRPLRPYGMMHGSEGIIRLALLRRARLAAGVGDAVVCTASRSRSRRSVAVAIALRGQRGLLTPGPDAPYSELSGALSLAAARLACSRSCCRTRASSPRNILATPSRESDLVGKFITGLFIARIPILLFQAVQAALLPKLAGLAGEGRHDDFRVGMRKLVLIVIGLGDRRHDRGGDDRSVRRRDAVRQGQVHSRPPRSRSARRSGAAASSWR